jgi:hypothetical protein
VLLDKDEGVMFGGSEWCGNKTYTLGWTQFPSFLKPNSDFYCSAALTPPGKGINPNEIHVSLWVDADDYETAELYEKYYSLLGQQKIWIPDGSRAKAPFSDESKLAGKSLTIWISDFGSYTYKYR